MRKTMLLFAVFLCLCFSGVSYANGASQAAEQYYPDRVWQVTAMGEVLPTTDAAAIERLFDGVRKNTCSLNIMGPKDALPVKVPNAKNNFTLREKPNSKVVFLISCGGAPGSNCFPSGNTTKCCPPCCPPKCY